MTDTGLIHVHVRWAPQDGFFLWGARYNGGVCDAYDLRDWLFAWHEPSFYGTFIEVVESQNVEGVLLPALEALDYLAAPGVVRHQRLAFGRELKELTQLAPHVKEALTHGRFMPDFAKWKAGELGWKLQLPEAAAAWSALPVAQYWLDRLIPAWIQEDGVMRQSLEQLERSFPLLGRGGGQAAELWMDEEDWLISIGWQSDGTPFRTCLKLEEPAESGGAWPLRVVLQDRSDKDVQHEVAPSALAGWAAAEP
ncbi:ATP-dependent helicase, partial [Paenibacillus ehimensis]|nr:ATP-dependent helicase [Paenibacillus ehimensis]